MSEDKVCTKDPCWSVGTIYDPKELLGVSTTDPGLDGVLGVQVYGAWRMWVQSCHMTWHDDTRHTDVVKRGGSWLRVDRRGRRSSKEGGF
jgi:hypothetical protein